MAFHVLFFPARLYSHVDNLMGAHNIATYSAVWGSCCVKTVPEQFFRSDRPVSGALILAKTSKAASRLAKAFRERKVTKIYRAVVEGDATK
ncbi:MAG: hypothetical protein JXR76_00075, partial [Deltaproteobacteria bacterium]|nr:hypothetical protein [Deltaproteobacteria bacterium]